MTITSAGLVPPLNSHAHGALVEHEQDIDGQPR